MKEKQKAAGVFSNVGKHQVEAAAGGGDQRILL